jgi:hypothetical protein
MFLCYMMLPIQSDKADKLLTKSVSLVSPQKHKDGGHDLQDLEP